MPSARSLSYDDAVRFLYDLQGFGVKLGLDNISNFLNDLGNPQHGLPAVHIAGTNGKGSTAALIAAILTEAGYRTALYTSPHLVDFRERIRVQGQMVPPRFVADWVARHRGVIRRRKITFFEATTALAFEWFRARAVDIAVIETGLGGRLDATNVLDPLLTIITSISRDHAHILGSGLRDIAREKAGITKPGVPCVVGAVDPYVGQFLRGYLSDRGVPLMSSQTVRTSVRIDGNGRTVLTPRSAGAVLPQVVAGFPGAHQARNASTVMAAVNVLRGSYGLMISDRDIRSGFRSVGRLTGLRGRCGEIEGRRGWFADVAHNPEAMESTVRYFRKRFGRGMRVIFGISSDKDARSVISKLRRVARELIVVEAASHRRLEASIILAICRQKSVPARDGGSVRDALRAEIRAGSSEPLLITGSHFVVGEALAFLQRRKYLTITQ